MASIELLEDKRPNVPRPYADLLEDGIHELRIKLTGTKEIRIDFFNRFAEKDIRGNNHAF